ncbi:MAG: acyltransferase family protein [Leifsonia sp.]|uniref:acyltransferase family protein n=1 Tax=Leifsonia sp. TaxID=1870902 RepID=UPI003F7E0390
MTAPAMLETQQPTTRRDARRSGFLPELQALRAVAVTGVVVYHLYPGVLRGGFVGVDVFFVISGFLITSHLLRGWATEGRIRFAAFYARRAWRLLPAALLVLLVTAALTILVLPERNWPQVFQEIGASTFYVENWYLAVHSVDYLAQNTDIASPVTHYWSLSVEEQFYLVWPLVLVAGGWVASRLAPWRRRAVLLSVLGAVFAASLVASVALTASDPSPAYFATQTRAWEFAAGGIVAVLLARSETAPRARAALSWAGLAAIAAALAFYTGAVPFPSWTALLPAAGTVAVIVAGSPEVPWAPSRLFELRPVQYLGDISYSLYLWHWPLIVFGLAVLGRLSLAGHAGVLVLSLVLAALTKRFIEEPLRRGIGFLGRPRYTLLATAAAMSVVLVASLAIAGTTTGRIDSERAKAVAALDSSTCLGAGSLAAAGCGEVDWEGGLIPGTAAAPTDDVNSIDCWSRNGDDRLKVCSEGPSTGAALRVALVGDSHSNQYLAALRALARKNRWHFDVYGKTGCTWSTVAIKQTADWMRSCDAWRAKVGARLASVAPYDVVITSYSATTDVVASPGKTVQQSVVDGFVDVWAPVAARGTKIVAIRDNPRPNPAYLSCIDAHPGDPGDACAVDEERAFHYFDGQPEAVRKVPNAVLLDLTPYFCLSDECDPVIGNVIVYRDANHLTSSYTRTLAPYLRAGVLKLTGLKEKPAA